MASTQSSWTSKLAISLAKKLLQKYRQVYTNKYSKDLKIILVAGTAGKSTLTMMIKSLFEKAGMQVFTGAKKEACLNSITGVTMMLADFELNFDGRLGKLLKVWFLIRGYIFLFFGALKLEEESVIVYEIGVDRQGEMEQFLEIFSPGVDIVLLANFTYEHTLGFDIEFDQSAFGNFQEFLPELWTSKLQNKAFDSVLRNITLEQLKLLSLTKSYIIPTNIGDIDNKLLYSEKGCSPIKKEVTPRRGANFTLAVDGFEVNSRYLLPLTFGKNVTMLNIIAAYYNIPENILQNTLHEIELPNGRYGKFNGIYGSTVIDSSYNSDPASLLSFLGIFEEVCSTYIAQSREGVLPEPYAMAPKHTFVLGEMRELGPSSQVEHKKILEDLTRISAEYGEYIEDIYLLGEEWLKLDDHVKKTEGEASFLRFGSDLFKVYRRAGSISQHFFEDTVRAGGWFWVKGSQNTIFSEIVVENLLANPADKAYLCRQGEVWNRLKLPYR